MAKPISITCVSGFDDLLDLPSFGQTSRIWDKQWALEEAKHHDYERDEALRRRLNDTRCAALQEAENIDTFRRTALEAAWKGRKAPIPEMAWLGNKHPERRTVDVVDVVVVPSTEYLGYGHLFGQRTKLPPDSPLTQVIASRSQSPPRVKDPIVQLLRPLVDAPDNQIFRATGTLKLRETHEFDSDRMPIGTLPAGTWVKVVSRCRLENGVERAAVARVGVHEGALGWITVSRDDRPPRRAVTKIKVNPAVEREQVGAPSAAEAGVPTAASSSAPASGPSKPQDASRGQGVTPLKAVAEAEPPQATKGKVEKQVEKVEKKKASLTKAEKKAANLAAGQLILSKELGQAVAQLQKDLAVEQAKFDDKLKPLTVLLGELMVKKQIKISDMVTQWAKKGGVGISKHEFRVHVRKLMEHADSKDVDALFVRFDEDGGGALDVAELKTALQALKDAALENAHNEADRRKLMQRVEDRLEMTKTVLKKTSAFEEADARFEALRNNKSLGARVGVYLQARNLKVGDLLSSWDTDGSGEVDKLEFKEQVLAMLGKGSASDAEIFELFDSLDLDGSGLMDIKEVGEALKALQNSAAEADQEIAQLKKVTAELWKTAKAAQVELRKVQKMDEAEATEIKAQIEEDRRARLEVERQTALKKAEARAMIMQAEAAKKKEFEEKIKARREAQKAILDAELKAFARAQAESETNTESADGVAVG